MKNYTFVELRDKTVINVCDGRQLGRVCDLEFTCFGKINGIIVPGNKKFFKNVTCADCVFISWRRIVKIGTDAVLVDLGGSGVSVMSEDGAEETNAAEPE